MDLSSIESTIKTLFELWAVKKRQSQTLTKVRYSGIDFGPEEYAAMCDAVFGNWWSNGKYTIKAERELARVSERNHALLFNSGSTANLALMLAARELYFGPGDKILTMACGFPTTVNPIIHAGLTPVFADIVLDTLSVSTADVVLDDVKGIFIPHTLGFSSGVNGLLDRARQSGIKVFYDACDAYCTKYEGHPVTHYGKAATMSFYAAHHISCGEGGAIVTNDQELFHVARGIRNWGRYCSSVECCTRSVDPNTFCPNTKYTQDSDVPDDYMANYQFEWLGYNFKMLELQAAILLEQIKKMKQYTDARIINYRMLYDATKDVKGIKIWMLPPGVSPFSFPMIVERNDIRKRFMDHLTRSGIESRMIFAGNLIRHPAYKAYKDQSLPNSDIIMNRGMMLGCSHVIDESGMQRIISAIKEFFK